MTELNAPRPKRLVIVMDGTWNSPATPSQRDDGDEVFKPTNPLKTCRAIKTLDVVAATLVVGAKPADGDTVSIDGKIYTFQDELTDQDGHVALGDGARKSLENLRYAINKRASRNRYAKTTTRHPSVTAFKVHGDRRSIELVPKPGAQGDPFNITCTSQALRSVIKHELAQINRNRGLNPTEGTSQVVYYDVGVGALRQTPGAFNKIHRWVDRAVGGAKGAGFEANVEDGYQFLSLNYHEGDEIYAFGFSRGASSARGLCRFIDWMEGILPSNHSYWIPRYFDAFLAGRSYQDTREELLQYLKTQYLRRHPGDVEKAEEEAQEKLGVVTPARIRFLGVWDSVLAIGKAREKPHVGPAPPSIVDHARQALAIDEHRPDFAPRIWQHKATADQTLKQRWFAGSHSNIGGGYVNDGLSNVALKWILSEVRDLGLSLDWQSLSYFRAYPQDQLYDSNAPVWRFLQFATRRGHLGVRAISPDENAGLTIDPSVFHRLVATPEGEDGRPNPKLTLYRPANLLRYLASVKDLDALLNEMPELGEGFELPPDVLKAIDAFR